MYCQTLSVAVHVCVEQFMQIKFLGKVAALALSTGLTFNIVAESGHSEHATRVDSHAPAGVMADHFHGEGEWMFSYRFMTMNMEGNLLDDDSISNDTIVTTISNRFFGTPGQPPTLRVVPTEMTTNMHMLGGMYGYSESLTLMAMVNYLEKEMDHVTYQGGMGTNVLGTFTTETSGFGDVKLGGLYRLADTGKRRWHATAVLSIPTGSIDETDEILTPMNMRPSPRLPYPMQLGSGTYDLEGGLTYVQYLTNSSWGAQWKSVIRLGENDEDYTLGNIHELTSWYAYRFNDIFSGSLRLKYFDRGNIDGADVAIVAPVQTANPNFHAAQRWDLGLGVNYKSVSGHRLGLEFIVPISQKLDGPQMEMQDGLTFTYQYSF